MITHRTLSSTVLALLFAASPGVSAPAKPVTVRTLPARPAPKPAPAATQPGVTAANLAATLKKLGYQATVQGPYLSLKVDEPQYSYSIDLVTSKSGDWLVCMSHLKPIPDLTKVPAAPLLALLSTNDSLLGMYFSYNRSEGSIMLNSSIPMRALDPGSLRNLIEGIKNTVRQTEGLWDAGKW